MTGPPEPTDKAGLNNPSAPVSGYPPGTPDHLQSYSSVHAALHDLLSLLTFVGLLIVCLVLARRFAGLAFAWPPHRAPAPRRVAGVVA